MIGEILENEIVGIQKSKLEVFKVQRAFNNDQVLIYNEDKSHVGQFTMTNKVLKLFGNKNKIFIEGRFNPKTKQVDMACKTKDREW